MPSYFSLLIPIDDYSICYITLALYVAFLHCMTGEDPRFLGRGFICINLWGVRFADFISSFLNIPWKSNNLVSLRLNYFIFTGYLKTGGGGGGGGQGGGSSEPLWVRHCMIFYSTHKFQQVYWHRATLRTPWKLVKKIVLRGTYTPGRCSYCPNPQPHPQIK